MDIQFARDGIDREDRKDHWYSLSAVEAEEAKANGSVDRGDEDEVEDDDDFEPLLGFAEAPALHVDLYRQPSATQDPQATDIRGDYDPGSPLSQVVSARETMPTSSIRRVIAEILDAGNFRRRDEDMRLVEDVTGLVVEKEGGVEEHYGDVLQRAESKTGHTDAAIYGVAEYAGRSVVAYALNWGFSGASFGVVEGQKYQDALAYAHENELPFLSILPTGGARQHEAVAALYQMLRTIYASHEYEKAGQLHMSLAVGRTFGGGTASMQQNADVIMGVAGSENGFAGRNLIEDFTRVPVEEGAQSVEACLQARTVDVVTQDSAETVRYIGKLLGAFGASQGETARQSKESQRTIAIGKIGVAPVLSDTDSEASQQWHVPRPTTQPATETENDILAKDFEDVMSSPGRVDLAYLAENVFDAGTVVPLFNHRVYEFPDWLAAHHSSRYKVMKEYPGIVAMMARLNGDPMMVIGNQPSYTVLDGRLAKRPASPEPKDIQYGLRMLDMAKRLGVPVLFTSDTLGAKPTIEAEEAGLSRLIQEMMKEAAVFPGETYALNSGGLGSGGGAMLYPLADRNGALSDTQAYVAHPKSAAAILYRTPLPKVPHILKTMLTMRVGALHQQKRGLVQDIIQVGATPYETAVNMRAWLESARDKMPRTQWYRLRKRSKRIRDFSGGYQVVGAADDNRMRPYSGEQ